MVQKIYCFKFRNRRGLIFLKANDIYDDKKLFNGEVSIQCLNTYIFKGTTYHPYAHLPDPHNLAISTKFRETLLANAITGWKTYPTSIENCEYEYWGLQVIGKTGVVMRPPQPGWVHGLNIDMSQWDGSDIFSSKDTFLILFTEKVRNVLLSNKLFSSEEMVDLDGYKWFSA